MAPPCEEVEVQDLEMGETCSSNDSHPTAYTAASLRPSHSVGSDSASSADGVWHPERGARETTATNAGQTEKQQKPVDWRSTARSVCGVVAIVFKTRASRCMSGTLLAALLLMSVLVTAISAWQSSLFKESTNALVRRDADDFHHVLVVIACSCAVHLPAVCAIEVLGGAFAIEWRRVVTQRLMDLYIGGNQAYYRLRSADDGVDNPDQRIGQDTAEFTVNAVVLLITVVGSSMKVAVMSGLPVAIDLDL